MSVDGLDSGTVFETSVRRAHNRVSDALNNYDTRPVLAGIRIGQARNELAYAEGEASPTETIDGELMLQFAIDHLDDVIDSFEEQDRFNAGVKVQKARGTLQHILQEIDRIGDVGNDE